MFSLGESSCEGYLRSCKISHVLWKIILEGRFFRAVRRGHQAAIQNIVTPWDYIALAMAPGFPPPGVAVPSPFSTPHWCFNRGVAGEKSRFIAAASALSSNRTDELYPMSKT